MHLPQREMWLCHPARKAQYLRTGRNGIEITQIAYRVPTNTSRKTSAKKSRRSLTGPQLSLQIQQARDNALAAMKISCPDRAGMYQMNNEYI